MAREISFKALKLTAKGHIRQIDAVLAKGDISPAAKAKLRAARVKLKLLNRSICGQTMVVGF
jgi:hypothetical protein